MKDIARYPYGWSLGKSTWAGWARRAARDGQILKTLAEITEVAGILGGIIASLGTRHVSCQGEL